ncbi:MAG TPA: hypothetical protein PLG47_01685 [Candidatus Dojkabacteria bacterium]|nr:hypothetical protein [Candidatus Dojkabacteria bacterium]
MYEILEQEQSVSVKEREAKEFWFYNDPLYQLCINLSYLNTSNNEAFGSILTQKINGVETIAGVGWNMFVGGETNMKRQGYSNHAEFQSMILAEVLGYDVSNSDVPTNIYSAGRLIKSDLLFLHPEGQRFSCTKCTSAIEKVNPNIHIVTPSAVYGWMDTPLSEAHASSLIFKQNRVKRDNSLDIAVSISGLNPQKTQDRMDNIVFRVEQSGILIDEIVKEVILGDYENILNLPIQERRALVENIFGSLM